MSFVNIDLNNRINENELKISFLDMFPHALEKYFLNKGLLDKNYTKEIEALKKAHGKLSETLKTLEEKLFTLKPSTELLKEDSNITESTNEGSGKGIEKELLGLLEQGTQAFQEMKQRIGQREKDLEALGEQIRQVFFQCSSSNKKSFTIKECIFLHADDLQKTMDLLSQEQQKLSRTEIKLMMAEKKDSRFKQKAVTLQKLNSEMYAENMRLKQQLESLHENKKQNEFEHSGNLEILQLLQQENYKNNQTIQEQTQKLESLKL